MIASDLIECLPSYWNEKRHASDELQVPSNCVGKQLIVKLAPWSCSLYENKTVACSPPYIEIIREPAVCTAKYHSATVFEGRSSL